MKTSMKECGVGGVVAEDFVGDLFWVPHYYHKDHGKIMLCLGYNNGMWKMLYIKSLKTEWHYTGTVNRIWSDEERAELYSNLGWDNGE